MPETLSHQQFKQIVKDAFEAIIVVDRNGLILFVNRQVEHYFGYTQAELVGQSIEILVPESLREKHVQMRTHYMVHPTTRPMGAGLKLSGRHKDGHDLSIEISLTPLPTAEGGLMITVMIHDITQHRYLEDRLAQQAKYDQLTNLLNEESLFDHLNYEINLANRMKQMFAVCFIDLDNFKDINDTYGHAAGDLLLQAVARRLVKSLRNIDVIARVGGDEFVGILSNIKHPSDIIPLVETLQRLFIEPFEVNQQSMHITASIGISVFPHDGGVDKILLKKADEAMYKAKHAGKNRYIFYKQED